MVWVVTLRSGCEVGSSSKLPFPVLLWLVFVALEHLACCRETQRPSWDKGQYDDAHLLRPKSDAAKTGIQTAKTEN
jgi:hypothetical protein